MQAAPLHSDVADGPPGGTAHWLTASDGLRLRIAHWTPEAARGTVLLFPGRTEFVEKYGPLAADLGRRGYALMAVDWRGQGLADRMLGDRLGGHVMNFSHYQFDVAAMTEAARALELPRPWHLLAHSMGGAIGLRALIEGLPVASAGFSSPMWGISIAAGLRPLAWSLSWVAGHVGLGHHYAPGTEGKSYINATDFEENLLTRDAEMYAWMARQTERYPDLALGGPSMRWLGEALRECRDLAARPAPPHPCLTVLGTDERIVDATRVTERMAHWPNGRLLRVAGARHETMMDRPGTRNRVIRAFAAHFDRHAGRPAAASA